jgi:hypothetical protein
MRGAIVHYYYTLDSWGSGSCVGSQWSHTGSGDRLKRRDFLKKTSTCAAAAAAIGLGDRALPAFRSVEPRPAAVPPEIAPYPMPAGRLGTLRVTRLIGGHSLAWFQESGGDVHGGLHLNRLPAADEWIFETFAAYEKAGINTAFLRITDWMVRAARRYVDERGGRLQWMAQLVIHENNQARNLEAAMKLGVHAAFIRGIEGDRHAPEQMDVLAREIERAKSCNIPIGLGGHRIETMIAAEKAGLPVDFYVKTFHGANTSMSGEVPGETAEFFSAVEKPWIAFKVLGPGRISARDAFQHAFTDGADFVSSAMFDFQLAEDARHVREMFACRPERMRPWRA